MCSLWWDFIHCWRFFGGVVGILPSFVDVHCVVGYMCHFYGGRVPLLLPFHSVMGDVGRFMICFLVQE